jgi:hypothetical protein
MQTRMRHIALGMGLILAAGCAGQQVATDYSPKTSFSHFRTFALVMPPDSASQQLLDQRVRSAMQSQLDAKGLTQADRQNADLFVGYGMVDKTHTNVYTSRDGWGWGGGWGWRYWRWGVAWPMTVNRQIETYTDGTVVVNLIHDTKLSRRPTALLYPGAPPVGGHDPATRTRELSLLRQSPCALCAECSD